MVGIVDEDKRDIGGAWGFVDFMGTEFNPKEVELTDEVIKFLINDSSEARSVPDINKELITKQKVDGYVESFKTKRKDSKEYLEASDFLKNYFDDSNKKEIDL